MASFGSEVSTKDLNYVRHRHISIPALREAITIVTNGTLAARDPAIWGDGTTPAPRIPSTLGPGIRI